MKKEKGTINSALIVIKYVKIILLILLQQQPKG